MKKSARAVGRSCCGGMHPHFAIPLECRARLEILGTDKIHRHAVIRQAQTQRFDIERRRRHWLRTVQYDVQL